MARTRRWHYPDRNLQPARPISASRSHAVGMFEEPAAGGVPWQPFSALIWGTPVPSSALAAQAPAPLALVQQNADLASALTQLQSVDHDGQSPEHRALASQLEAALLPPSEQPEAIACMPVLRRRRGIEI